MAFPEAKSLLWMRLYDRTAWDEKGSDAEPLLVIHGAELEVLLDFLELNVYRQMRIGPKNDPWNRTDIDAKFDH